jgi:anthranilate synthase/aminodeoxychorismate synthase-like glutamine amidotransferase
VLLLVDNHDSFTHNLAHLLAAAWEEPEVVRVDALTPESMVARRPQALVLSPGPGRPERMHNLLPLLRAARGRLPVLGICLGHQAMGMELGYRLVRAPRPVHGHAHPLEHADSGLLAGCRPGMLAARYHSLVLDMDCAGPLPRQLRPGLWMDARCAPDLPMALRHEDLGWWGLQFHPESFLGEEGLKLMRNFRWAASAWSSSALRADTESASLPAGCARSDGVACDTPRTPPGCQIGSGRQRRRTT